jgi:small-conductance mechanosensitive channel
MAWIIQNNSNSIVCIDDLGIVLQRGQTRDVDLLGRENAERSRFLRNALSAGLLTEVKKDAYTPPGTGIDSQVVDAMKKTTEQAVAAAEAAQEAVKLQSDTIQKQNQVMAEQSAALKSTTAALDRMKELFERFPEEMRAIKDAMTNIKVERSVIAEKQATLTDGTSDAEMKMQEKILKKRDAALEKNYKHLGETVTKKVDAELGDALDAMNELDL